MNISEINKAIERLKAINAECESIYSVVEAFIDKEIVHATDAIIFRDELVDVLKKALSLFELGDSELIEHGLMYLPKDKDGVPCRVGDVMQWPNGDRFEVIGVSHGTLFYGDSDRCEWTMAINKTHYHEPTIKDVLRDFLSAVEEAKRKGYDDVPDEEYVECAEKLREVMDA